MTWSVSEQCSGKCLDVKTPSVNNFIISLFQFAFFGAGYIFEASSKLPVTEIRLSTSVFLPSVYHMFVRAVECFN